MFGCIEYSHISANFREDTDCSKGVVDAGDSHHQLDLRDIVFGNVKDERFQFHLVLFQKIHMAADNLEFFRLFMGEDAVNSFLDFGSRRFTAVINKGRDIKRFTRMFQQLCCDCG